MIVHSEGPDKISASGTDNPLPQLSAVVECSVGGYEDSDTALTQLAHVLGDTEIMYVSEFSGKVFVACRILHIQSRDKRYVGDGQVYAAVRDAGLLKALYIHLRIGIQQRKDRARCFVYLYGMYVAAFTDIGRHLLENTADAC